MATPGANADDKAEGPSVMEPDFPLNVALYHYEPATPRDVPFTVADPQYLRPSFPAHPQVREWTSFYDIENLVLPKQYPPPERPLGELRKGWTNMLESEEGGKWEYIEYVPSWTDPNWSHRFIFLPGVDIPKGETDDPLLQQHAKTGTLQKLHPALTINSVLFKPTTEAKRWGFYPFHSYFGYTDRSYSSDIPTGHSGATPIKPWFPLVPLKIPGPTPTNQDTQYSVSQADLIAERENYKRICQGSGQAPSQNGFGFHLQGKFEASEPGSQAKAVAEALITLWELLNRRKELEAYQRMIFMNHTAQDLIDQHAWTTGMDATTDLAAPLHDLVTRDKWRNTNDGSGDGTRYIYSFPGIKGEYSAHDDRLWAALQPALQLVSKVLYSNHSATWAAADLRRYRGQYATRGPEYDSDSSSNAKGGGNDATEADDGVDAEDQPLTENEGGDDQATSGEPSNSEHVSKKGPSEGGAAEKIGYFSCWPQFKGDPAELKPRDREWEELVTFYNIGFDSTRYVCEILSRTIQWDMKPRYKVAGGLDDSSLLGVTSIYPLKGQPIPFKIVAEVVADYVWPLLIDEYSPAEKASCSFLIAVVILHELAHCVPKAAVQLWQPSYPPRELIDTDEECSPLGTEPLPGPGRSADGEAPSILDMPHWVQINPAWQHEIEEINRTHNIDLLRLLQTMGLRSKLDPYAYKIYGLVFSPQVSFEYEPEVEEGSSTETRYFGGVMSTVTIHQEMFTRVPPRFIGDVSVMIAMQGWATHPDATEQDQLCNVLPFDFYGKFFREGFWNSEHARFGPLAMRYSSKLHPVLRNLHQFKWGYAVPIYGRPATLWMEKAWKRLRLSPENPSVWRWLFARLVESVAVQATTEKWFCARSFWWGKDNYAWRSVKLLKPKHEALMSSLSNVVTFNDSIVHQHQSQVQHLELQKQQVQQQAAQLQQQIEQSQHQMQVLEQQQQQLIQQGEQPQPQTVPEQEQQQQIREEQRQQRLQQLQQLQQQHSSLAHDLQNLISQRDHLQQEHNSLEAQQTQIRQQADDRTLRLPLGQLLEYCEHVAQLVSDLNAEIYITQSLVLDLLKITRIREQDFLNTRYGARVRARMEFYTTSICQNALLANAGVLAVAQGQEWLRNDPDAQTILTQTLPDLDAKIKICQAAFADIHAIMDTDSEPRAEAIKRRFKDIPSGVVQGKVAQYQLLALSELRRMPPNDPQLMVAKQWMKILNFAEELYNPRPGTDAAELNARLAQINVSLEQGVADEEEAVQNRHPDDTEEHEVTEPVLLQTQPPQGSIPQPRNFTIIQGAQFANASGFQPYVNPVTGFNHFAHVQGQAMPPASMTGMNPAPMPRMVATKTAPRPLPQQQQQQQQQPQLAAAGPSGSQPPSSSTSATVQSHQQQQLEEQISLLSAQLRQVQQQGTDGLSHVPLGLRSMFGMSAAQQAQALQRLEALIRQTGDVTLGIDQFAASQDPAQDPAPGPSQQ